MFTHDDIWEAIDELAQKHGLSTSALAKKAGLDPTTFNKSKRKSAEGKLRWPSTESISKILAVTGETVSTFMKEDTDNLSIGTSVVIKTTSGTLFKGLIQSRTEENYVLELKSGELQELAHDSIHWKARVISS